MSLIIALAALWLLVINVLTHELFRIDKARAGTGDWRIPESTLLTCALLGGTIGARIAQRQFRHKTRKQPFRGLLAMVGALQFGVLVVGGFLTFATPFGAYVGRVFSEPLLARSTATGPAPVRPSRNTVIINRGLP